MADKTITAYESLPLTQSAVGSPVEITVLRGVPESGPAAVMVRFPEVFQEPWHSHTTTYHSMLIKGEFQIKTKDAKVTESEVYGPGSYTVQPGVLFTQKSTQGQVLLTLFYMSKLSEHADKCMRPDQQTAARFVEHLYEVLGNIIEY